MNNERVLIVDDEESVRWVLKKAMEKEGLETALAKDATEAFSLLQEGGIAVVLMDIRMPNLNGLEATRQIVGSTDDPARVIVLTWQDK